MRKRRKPYGQIPPDVADNGFVIDLEYEFSLLADRFGVHVHKFRKNDDWFLAMRVPTAEELAMIDRTSG